MRADATGRARSLPVRRAHREPPQHSCPMNRDGCLQARPDVPIWIPPQEGPCEHEAARGAPARRSGHRASTAMGTGMTLIELVVAITPAGHPHDVTRRVHRVLAQVRAAGARPPGRRGRGEQAARRAPGCGLPTARPGIDARLQRSDPENPDHFVSRNELRLHRRRRHGADDRRDEPARPVGRTSRVRSPSAARLSTCTSTSPGSTIRGSRAVQNLQAAHGGGQVPQGRGEGHGPHPARVRAVHPRHRHAACRRRARRRPRPRRWRSTTTTTLPAGGCGSFNVSGGGGNQVGFAATTTVTVTLSLTGCGSSLYVNLSNDGTTWGPDLLYDASDPSTGVDDRRRQRHARASRVAPDRAWPARRGSSPQQSIILDTTLPTTPGTLTRTVVVLRDRTAPCPCPGASPPTPTSPDTASTAAPTAVSWQIVASTTGTTATNTHSKGLASVRFYVKAYDKAGNESNATNTITLSKNQCS